jgi:CRISPR-associated DxTHG motif protein
MQIFSLVNNLIDKYDRVIVDLTHGFRHLPLLTIIDLIIHNFKQNQKIEKILFAKEMVKHTPKDKGEYEIIDLKEYLDIANLSFVLSTFEQNYTVSNHIKTVDKDYQVLIDILSKFSEHIMANSLVNLLQKNNSLIEQITGALDTAINHPKSQPLTIYLKSIKKHFEDDFIVLKDKEKYIQLFELAKIMKKKGYYLNAITLLNEAVGWYCIISLINFNGSLKNEYKKALNNSWDTYQVVSEAKNIIKYTFNEREYTNKLKIKNINELQNQIENNKNTKKFSRDLIQEIDKHRNNLAHANSGNEIENVEKLLEKLFGRFQTYCIDDNILKKTPASIEDLKNKFS